MDRLRSKRWYGVTRSASGGSRRTDREPLEWTTYPLRPAGSVLVADVKGHGAGSREHNPMGVSG